MRWTQGPAGGRPKSPNPKKKQSGLFSDVQFLITGGFTQGAFTGSTVLYCRFLTQFGFSYR